MKTASEVLKLVQSSVVLVIEDNAFMRSLMRGLLTHIGVKTVYEAADGVSALRLAQKVAMDVVICDVFIPEQDGLETIQRFRRIFPVLPIVAMSGGGCGSLMDLLPMARHLGADRVLHKPFGRATLVSLLEEVLAVKPAVEPR